MGPDSFDPVFMIAEWLRSLLLSWNLSAELTEVILKFIGAAVVGGLVMAVFIFQIWFERKAAARFQDRIGPNRVGPWGIIQPIADALKMMTKEDTTPAKADKVTYNLAPIVSVFSVLMMWAVIPFTQDWIGTDLNIGVLYIAAVGSFSVLAILMAGWSSNNKYSLLGAFRGVAQLISYEVPLFLSLLVPVFLARSMGINDIVEAQGSLWFILFAPLAFVIYTISSLAEVGRSPFDLLEAESEIVAGYHVEYSGMKFGLFQAGEWLHAFTFGALASLLFFGGWQGPFVDKYPLLGLVYFLAKTMVFYFLTVWSRLTFPRVRIDQIMGLNWKFLVPLSLLLLMGIPIVDYFFKASPWRWAALLAFNVLLGLLALEYARRAVKRRRRPRVKFEGRPLAVPPKDEEAGA
jgi:NADH-quinone oxidoreductase subunit H